MLTIVLSNVLILSNDTILYLLHYQNSFKTTDVHRKSACGPIFSLSHGPNTLNSTFFLQQHRSSYADKGLRSHENQQGSVALYFDFLSI